MTVMLVFLLSAGHLAAVDPKKLADLVKGFKTKYGKPGMFSLAMSIPDEGESNFKKVLEENP